jgi:hypothetical protein
MNKTCVHYISDDFSANTNQQIYFFKDLMKYYNH